MLWETGKHKRKARENESAMQCIKLNLSIYNIFPEYKNLIQRQSRHIIPPSNTIDMREAVAFNNGHGLIEK